MDSGPVAVVGGRLSTCVERLDGGSRRLTTGPRPRFLGGCKGCASPTRASALEPPSDGTRFDSLHSLRITKKQRNMGVSGPPQRGGNHNTHRVHAVIVPRWTGSFVRWIQTQTGFLEGGRPSPRQLMTSTSLHKRFFPVRV